MRRLILALVIILILTTYTKGHHYPEYGYQTPKNVPQKGKSVCEKAENVREIPKIETSRGGVRALKVVATAYTHTGYQTKNGTWPRAGRTVAVDPNIIPLGSRVWIDGYGWRVAEDTGGAIKGHRVDLFLETEEECWQFGRREIVVRFERGE